MNVAELIDKWAKVELTERSASQQHFLDLCELLDHPKPAEADPTGEFFTFEKGAAKKDGSDGWADVWKRGYFAWEYKGKHKDLDAAYLQLDQYRAALENPPLLVTCDMDRIVVHTNFTATKQEVHDIPLQDLDAPRNLEILRAVFTAPHKLKPGSTSEAITAEAARTIGELAVGLRERGLDPRDVAHFLDRVVFSFFAEDIELLPGMVFTRLLEKSRSKPEIFRQAVAQLFEAMNKGGLFGAEEIRRFNGNLFESGPILDLGRDELEALYSAARLDWSAVDPSIFGTLFERGMDPDKRSQLGAHYTSREDIETLVEPVVMKPLRREWNETQQLVANLLTTGKKHPTRQREKKPLAARERSRRRAARRRSSSAASTSASPRSTSSTRPAAPATSSTSPSRSSRTWRARSSSSPWSTGFTAEIPLVGPWQLHGIEINPYAFELAQMTVWIGYLQWTRQRGFGTPDDPVLRPMDTFECKDAILDLSDPENPKEPEWPKVDFIVGNPPFLGGKKMRSELSDEYVDQLFALWRGRVPAEADLVTYWFEKAREQIEQGRAKRAGLLATQGIRGGANREVLKAIKESGEIFFAESDREWILDGAAVHVSMVGFGQAEGVESVLDGREVEEIHSNLSASVDVTKARRLPGKRSQAFMGDTKGGPFDIEDSLAQKLLEQPNPHGRPNSDVVVPWVNGRDITQRPRFMWIIDFGLDVAESVAAMYEAPFRLVEEQVQAIREVSRSTIDAWWLHERPRGEMRRALEDLARYLATPRVTKHRLFVWRTQPVLPDSQVIALSFEKELYLGLLLSLITVVGGSRALPDHIRQCSRVAVPRRP